MAIKLSQFIRATIDDVFAFFDDQMKPLEFNAHAVRLEVSTSSRTADARSML